MKTTTNQRLAWRFIALALASLAAGCSGQNGSPGDDSEGNGAGSALSENCTRGVSSANGCVNKAQCAEESDCVGGYHCSAERVCKPNKECMSDTDCAAGGTCETVLGKKLCVNPVVCDRDLSGVGFVCSPGFYCDSSRECKPVTAPTGASCSVDGAGCDKGVCQEDGTCGNPEFCSGNGSCLDGYICNQDSICVSKESDKACNNACHSGAEGGVCNRYRGECVNVTSVSCTKDESCECPEAVRGNEEDCFLKDLGNKSIQELSALCTRGYHWESQFGCQKDKCEDNSDCLRSLGGGVCDTIDRVCVEPTTSCSNSGECIPKSLSSGRRLCVAEDGQTRGTCEEEAEVCRECESVGKTCKIVKGTSTTPVNVVCVDTENKCKRSADCVEDGDRKICMPDGTCKEITQADKDACELVGATKEKDHPSSAISSLVNGASSVEQGVCDEGPFYYTLNSSMLQGKNLRVTVTLKGIDVGNVIDVVPSVTVDGREMDSPEKESAPEGSWSYLFKTKDDVTDSGTSILKLAFTGKGERLATGAHFTIRLDYVDPKAEASCASPTNITFNSKGSWEGGGTLTARSSGKVDPVALACSGKTSVASDLYTFKLGLTQHVVVKVADKLGGTTPSLVVRRGCAYEDFPGSSCSEANVSGGLTTYQGVLSPGEYTIIVAGNEGDYSLSVETEDLNCTPRNNYCIKEGENSNKLSYCDVDNNLSGQIKECREGCDSTVSACVEDYGRACISARPIMFDADTSGRRVVFVNLSNYTQGEKFGLSGACPGGSGVDATNTGGANAFFHVTVPPHQILNVSKKQNPFGDNTWMSYASFTLYALDGCGSTAQCLSGKFLGRGQDGELTYANNTSESKDITVVLDTADTDFSSGVYYNNGAYNAELEFMLTSYGECDQPGKERCYNNREIQACQANGVWETISECSPRAGCKVEGGLATAVCNTLSNEECGGALDITNTAINASFRYVQTTSPRSMATTDPGAVACGRLSYTDGQGSVKGHEPLGRVLFYKVSASSLDKGKKGKAVVRLTPEDGAKSFMRLWKVKGHSCLSDSSISCEDGLGQKDFAYVANDSKRSLMLEFDVDGGKEYRVAVEQADGESGDQPFKIESKVVEDSGSDTCDPQKTAVSCDSSAGKVSYCSKGGVKLDIECACGANGSAFCDKFAGANSDIGLDSTCAAPVVLRAQSNVSETSGSAATQNNLSYVGTAGGAIRRRVFNQFEPTVGKHGSCYFGEKTIGYEQVFAVYLKEGEVLSASVAASKSGNPVPSETKFADATRLYLLTECGNIETCEGLGTSNNSLSYKKTDSAGYVYLVVDNISTDFNYAGIGRLSWNVTASDPSSKKCEPNKLYCKDAMIAMCNSDGTGHVPSTEEACPSGMKCIDGEARCGFESKPGSKTCELIADLGTMSSGKEKLIYYDPEKVPEVDSSFNGGGLNPAPTKAMAVKVKVSGADKVLKVVGRGLGSAATPMAYVTGKDDSSCKDTSGSPVAKSGDVVKKGSRDYETELYYKPSAHTEDIVVVLTTKEVDASAPFTFTISEIDAVCTPGEYSCADDSAGSGPSVVSLCGADYKLVEDYRCPDEVKCDLGAKKCSEKAVELFQPVREDPKPPIFTNPAKETKTSYSAVMPRSQSLYNGSVSCGSSTLDAMPGGDVVYKVTAPGGKTLTVTAIDANSNSADKKPLTLILATSSSPGVFDCKSYASTTSGGDTPAVLTSTSTDTNQPAELYVIVDSANTDLNGKTVNLTFSVTGSVELTSATSPVTEKLKMPTQSNYGSAEFTCAGASSTTVPAMPAGDFLYKVKVPAGKKLTVTAVDSDTTDTDKKAVALTVVKDLSDLSSSCVAYAANEAGKVDKATVMYTAGGSAAEDVYVIVDSASTDLNEKMVELSFSSSDP